MPKKKLSLRDLKPRKKAKASAGSKPKVELKVRAPKAEPPTEEDLNRLMKKAEQRNFLTENEVLFAFPEVEDYLPTYEAFLDRMEERHPGRRIEGRHSWPQGTVRGFGSEGEGKETARFDAFGNR